MATYGAVGRFGVGVPQSNPTVEPEMAVLMPRNAAVYVTRLTSGESQPQARLRTYIDAIETYLAAYDDLSLSAFGFACTGSSYLIGPEIERGVVEAASRRFGYPVLTAADAIVWAAARIGARRIALVAPYPDALIAAGAAYFEMRGLEVVSTRRVVTRTADTRSIYELTPDQAGDLAETAQAVDAVLISGTGMPSLPLLAPQGSPPILSSNLCLAARLLDAAGRGDLLDGVAPVGWRDRLVEALREGAKT